MAYLLVLAVAGFFIIKRIRKNRNHKTEYPTFEEDFEKLYGTTWESWVSVKRDLLTDDTAFIVSLRSVFNDMYVTVQKKEKIK